jgi:hypothetical protein
MGRRGIAPLIRNLDTKTGKLHAPVALFTVDKPRYSLQMTLGGLHRQNGRDGENKNPLSLRDSNLGELSPYHSRYTADTNPNWDPT